jgi:hypothetical protein
VDGVTLINNSTVMAAGGYPYVISNPGSYKLSGNLTVPDGNTTAIVIAHDNVTIDLNGFSILGPVNCTPGGGLFCGTGGNALGYGIRAGSDSPMQAYFNITIRNGMIQGMGADGIHLLGDNILVEDLRVRSNGLSGIVVRSSSLNPGQTNLILHHNTVQLTGSYGIKTYGGVITDNTIDQAGNSGISVQFGGGGGATVARNVVSRCTEFGLSLDGNASYFGNTMVANNGGGSQVFGGINVGQNVCNNTVCPGAQF